MGDDVERRTVLSRAVGALAATALAGCSTSPGGESTTTGDAGEQATLAMTTTESTSGGGDGGGGDDDAGGDGSDVDRDDESTGASTDASGSGETTARDAGSTTATTSDEVDVAFRALIESIEPCSKTCRTLTYAVQNRGSDPAPDVTVRIGVSTGGKQIWEKEQDVGTIDPRSQRTGISRDVDVGIFDGRKIRNNDGEVTIELTPQAAGASETFTFERTLDV